MILEIKKWVQQSSLFQSCGDCGNAASDIFDGSDSGIDECVPRTKTADRAEPDKSGTFEEAKGIVDEKKKWLAKQNHIHQRKRILYEEYINGDWDTEDYAKLRESLTEQERCTEEELQIVKFLAFVDKVSL